MQLRMPTEPINSERELLRQQMLRPVLETLPSTGLSDTPIPGLRLFRSDAPTSVNPTLCEPTVCLLLQGSKQLLIGDEILQYNTLQFLLVPVLMPVSSKIIKANSTEPYLGLSLNLDLVELSTLILELGETNSQQSSNVLGISVGNAELALLCVFQRLLTLLQQPKDIPVLLPLIKRELLYRLLQGPQGGQLRAFTAKDSNAGRIGKVIELLHQRFAEPLRIKDLAAAVHLSESALFQSFKTVTAMSPLQFQKQLRLNEARRIMLQEGTEAATASYRVGYESPSQFSREYSRLFGAPPKADMERLRRAY